MYHMCSLDGSARRGIRCRQTLQANTKDGMAGGKIEYGRQQKQTCDVQMKHSMPTCRDHHHVTIATCSEHAFHARHRSISVAHGMLMERNGCLQQELQQKPVCSEPAVAATSRGICAGVTNSDHTSFQPAAMQHSVTEMQAKGNINDG